MKMGGRKVNADGDGPDENNKAEAEPPTVTEPPLFFLTVDNGMAIKRPKGQRPCCIPVTTSGISY
ncbi:hypothetical protein T01_3494 [Trichinella spiralis]|uniref:Uncharacterized protein n=1 Tax=Trichinella spiralis TaxID=6334 RepID=A0A0V1BTT2_TRISP|nr:hypothetical protein T01_3494 [Trichinella spiralis]